jgi:hypothetical protein
MLIDGHLRIMSLSSTFPQGSMRTFKSFKRVSIDVAIVVGAIDIELVSGRERKRVRIRDYKEKPTKRL